MESQLANALSDLRDTLSTVRLPLPLPHADDLQRVARDVNRQVDDYVLPRLRTIEAPLLCVVGGSTGAGKSTLVNSLIGRVVSRPGVIRPTTRSPVLVHHPDDARWFTDDRILPGLIRSTISSSDTRSLQIVTEPSIPKGLALLDAPDIDSVEVENRKLAAQLLAAADLWLFVTSAARYADAVPWEYLKQAAGRSAAVAVVIDRVPPAAMRDVPAHLGQMMTERGLASSPLFAVPETTTDADGVLPDAAVSPIRGWLAALAADQRTRARVVMQTLDGAIGAVCREVPVIADAVDDQSAAIDRLRQDAESIYRETVASLATQTADGTLLRGEVLARWQDFVGSGEFIRAMQARIAWLRDKIVGVFSGDSNRADQVKVAVESGLEALLREGGENAAERAEASWLANPAGRYLLERTADDLGRPTPEFPSLVGRMIRDWQLDVLELVSQEGKGRRSRARFAAFGVNGIGVALMLVVFSQTGGLVGAEIGVAGGTAILAQKVLELVFGDDAVRKLSRQAKQELDARVQALMAGELSRYHVVLDGSAPAVDVGETLRTQVAAVEASRRQELAALGLAAGAPDEIEGPSAPIKVNLTRVDIPGEPVEAVMLESGQED